MIAENPQLAALSAAIEIVGGPVKLARQISVSASAPSMWRKRGKVPAEHCAPIEAATGRVVTRQMLRPDDWRRIWPELVTPPALDAQPEQNAGQQTEQAPA